jgi:glucuronokinase
MDRVAQIYDGLVYMDFERSYMEAKGYGKYEVMDIDLLPAMFIAWTTEQARESGRIHNPIHDRFMAGDPQVATAMGMFARLAEEGKDIIEGLSYDGLAHFMRKNFQYRCGLYGIDSIGEHNLRMVEIAAEYGCAAKLTGSGGAVVGLYTDDKMYNKLRIGYESEGYYIQKVIPRDNK